jgi:hypothetical protein
MNAPMDPVAPARAAVSDTVRGLAQHASCDGSGAEAEPMILASPVQGAFIL